MDTSTGSVDEDGPSEFIFVFKKKNFSQIESSVSSPPCIINDMLWQIVIKKNESKTVPGLGKYLGFYLSCNRGTEHLWNCRARATLTVVSNKKDIPNSFRIIECLFESERNEFGFSEFLDWRDVTNPLRGFIEDDTVKFQVHILADTPNIVDLFPNTSDYDDDDDYDTTEDPPQKLMNTLSSFANEMDENLVCRISQEVKDATNSLGKEHKTFLENVIKELKGDLKIYIESALDHLRKEINSVKNDAKVCPNCCGKSKKDTEEPEFQSEIHKIMDNKISEELYQHRLKFSQNTFPRRRCDHNPCCYDDYNPTCPTYAPPRSESHWMHNCKEQESNYVSCSHRPNEEHSIDECQMSFDSYEEKNELEDTNIYEDEPLENELLLISRDENGQLKTFRPRSVKELYALKVKYPDFEIL